MTAKTRAIPSLHRDPPAGGLKYQDSARMRRRVTQPPFIAGPLGLRDTLRQTGTSNAQKQEFG
jgi:hypothetical protein